MTTHIGASTGCCTDMPVLEVIHALAAIGIAGIELGTPPRHFNVWERAQVLAVRQALEATGVRAVAIHAPFGGLLDLSDPNPHHRSAAIGAIVTAAEVLHELRGRVIVVHPTDVPRHGSNGVERLRAAGASLRTLVRVCGHMGMTVAIESPLPHLLGGAPAEFAQLLDDAGAEARVCLDTGHTTLGHQWDAFAAIANGRLVHVHAHDHRGTFDDHFPPGEGIVPWPAIAASLGAIDFEGWTMLELRCPTEPIAEYFRRASRALAGLLNSQASPASTGSTS